MPADAAGAPRALLALVYGALLGLVVVPVATFARARAIRGEIRTTVVPAQEAARSLVAALLVESWTVTRTYVIDAPPAGDARERIRAAAAMESRALARLDALRPRLPAHIEVALERLRAQVSGARRSGAFPEAGAAAAPRARSLLATLDAYEAAIRGARALLTVIDQEVRVRRDRIDGIERVGLLLMVGLAFLAGAAAVGVLRLSRRVRLLGHEAERRRHEAERLMESKARLIRGIGHDVKNPLSAVQAYADLLHKGALGPLSPAHTDYVARIARLTRTAFGIVEELLVLSSAEAGELGTSLARTDMGAVAREAAEDARALAEAAGLDLRADVGHDVPPVTTDAARVAQVVGNLVSNAIKYTPRGGAVAVRARDGQRGPLGAAPSRGAGWAAIDVVDTGPGVPSEQQERIFEEFVRLEQRETMAPGAGLGLAISRSIAHHLGGELTVESEPGHGSTFTLWLPADARTA